MQQECPSRRVACGGGEMVEEGRFRPEGMGVAGGIEESGQTEGGDGEVGGGERLGVRFAEYACAAVSCLAGCGW